MDRTEENNQKIDEEVKRWAHWWEQERQKSAIAEKRVAELLLEKSRFEWAVREALNTPEAECLLEYMRAYAYMYPWAKELLEFNGQHLVE